MMHTSSFRLFCHTSRIALTSSLCLLPTAEVGAYRCINTKAFATEQSAQILTKLEANDSLLKVHALVAGKMEDILNSSMVQGMAKGTLTKEEWERKYMRADALYIYKLGQALAKRSENETVNDQSNVMEFADMFLGYGRHFDRLKKYGLSAHDKLDSPQCENHVAFLSKGTSIKEFYVSILTDMIPYVVFANYLLNSIEPSDDNPWIEYAQKYGDLNSKYAKEKLGKTIQIANKILANKEMDISTAEDLFLKGFAFEEWFIRNAFTEGFHIIPMETMIEI